MDKISIARRSENMRRIRSKDTKPEMMARWLVHGMGYRYRLHAKDLPGKPDMVFRSRKKAIFVHGCFWHQHTDPCCKISRKPKSKESYWIPKLERNKQRDKEHQITLKSMGWTSLIIWECEMGNSSKTKRKIKQFLD